MDKGSDGMDSSRRALRIDVVTETWPPEVNGVARTLARAVRGLQSRGHELTVVRPAQLVDASGGGAVAEFPVREVLVSGMPIPRYPHLRIGLPCIGRLTRLWRSHEPDIVHVATEGPLGLSAVVAAHRLGLPVTSDFRTNFHAYAAHYGARWLHRPMLGYLRAFHNRTAVTMVPTEALRMRLLAEGFRDVEWVSRGVDVEAFSPLFRCEELRQDWRVAPDDPVLLYVGRLAAEKNLGLLVQSYNAATQARPGTRLVIVGDGPLRESLQQSLPDAIFAGQRRGDDLARHFASADLFVFPSVTETFGNVVAEAMASGLAVLAFDEAAAAQLIEPGRSGMVVARGNEAQFVRAAAALACSKTARLAVGVWARQRAMDCGWDRVVDRLEALLHRHARPTPASAALQSQTPATPCLGSARRAAPLA